SLSAPWRIGSCPRSRSSSTNVRASGVSMSLATAIFTLKRLVDPSVCGRTDVVAASRRDRAEGTRDEGHHPADNMTRPEDQSPAERSPAKAVLLAQLLRQERSGYEIERLPCRAQGQWQWGMDHAFENVTRRTGHRDLLAREPLLHVEVEIAEGRWDDRGRRAQGAGKRLHLLVVGLPVPIAERPDPTSIHQKGRVDESRVDPHHQRGVGSRVASSRRKRAHLLRYPALHLAVERSDPRRDTIGFGPVPEDDGPNRGHRPLEPLPRILAIVGVRDDAGGDEGVRNLHQQRPAAAQHQKQLPADPSDHAVVREIAPVLARSLHDAIVRGRTWSTTRQPSAPKTRRRSARKIRPGRATSTTTASRRWRSS